jgi:MSHA biogenesis protein MshJ
MTAKAGPSPTVLQRIDALSLRERLLIFAAIALLGIVLVQQFALHPLQVRRDLARQQLDGDAARMRQDATRLASAGRAVGSPADAGAEMPGLVPAEAMPALLQDLLRQTPAVQLISVKSLPVQQLPTSPGLDPIYVHGVEFAVSGSYADLTDTARRIEAMHWRLLWRAADVDGAHYPDIVMTMKLYTLSLDPDWLTL